MHPKLKQAKELADTEPDEALRLCNDVLNDHYVDQDGEIALFMVGYIFMKAKRYGLAYHIYARCAQMRPDRAEIYSNMGMCLEDEQPKQAMQCFDKALQIDPKYYQAIANKGLCHLRLAEPAKCLELSKKALGFEPKLTSALQNKALANLMLRNWKEGWKGFYDTIGIESRKQKDYGAQEWKPGVKPGSIVVYGEQGVGDEIMYASCIEDLLRDGFEVILDVDERLESLFKRSFPDCTVYGDRFKPGSRVIDNHKPRYQAAIGQLPHQYRNKENSFPGKPYLSPNREYAAMWSARQDMKIHKNRVGIAWSGGLRNTGKTRRTIDKEIISMFVDPRDVVTCLDYKPVDPSYVRRLGLLYEERDVKKGGNIDYLTAIVSTLDYVVTPCNTLVYIAGALGVPCFVLVPAEPSYRYHAEGNFPWYKSVHLHRQKPGEPWTQACQRLKEFINAEGFHWLRR